MRAVVQRVTRASVEVEGEILSSIGLGLLVLLAVHREDKPSAATKMASKLCMLRVFGDSEGKMNLSVIDVAGSALVVSQFTLYGETKKGNRPSFVNAAAGEHAEALVESVVAHMEDLGVPAKSGRFGAHMKVELLNDGPVTLIVET